VELDHYSGLIPNGKMVYDIIIRNARLRHADGWSHPVDLGLLLEAGIGAPAVKPANVRDRRVVLKEIGDLRDFGALESIDGHDRPFASTSVTVDKGYPLSDLLDLLQL
jgi:hypothetical protein